MIWMLRTNFTEGRLAHMLEWSQGTLNPAPTNHKQRQVVELRTEGKHVLLQGKPFTPLWLA